MKATRQINRAFIGLILGLGLLITACKKDEGEAGGAPPAPEGIVLATGSFEGRSDHEVSGGVEIVESEGTYFINLGIDFSLDGAPVPTVGLGKDGYQKETKAGDLKEDTGRSTYKIPDGIDPKEYNEVYIWCEKFDVPLGVAKLTAK